jgi:3-hydroxybutyryl-CoA dehydrogenase
MDPSKVAVGVVGAGTMGTGIARLAHRAGHPVEIYDADPGAVARAVEAIKGDAPAHAAASLADLASRSDLVIEAVFEDLDLKRSVFQALDTGASATAVLASNTSALSISSLAAATERPQSVLGVHFMNFARFGPLVEVIHTTWSDPSVVDHVSALVRAWGLSVVRVRDAPGFLVNRVNRLFTLEPIRLVAEGEAGVVETDRAFLAAGFPMGPMQFVDFVGADLHLTVSTALYEAFFHEPRFRPSALQRRLVESGQLGRKTGTGFYRYDGDRELEAAPAFVRDVEPALDGATVLHQTMLATANEAFHTFGEGVASLGDIDLAMTVGLRYPDGPVAWARSRGLPRVVNELETLVARYGDRYRPAAALRRAAT